MKKVRQPWSRVFLPPTNIKREEVFGEFEILFAQLLHHKPKSIDKLSLPKAKLNELAHSFCSSPIDVTKFPFDSDCLQAIKSLRSNKHILITKPDKGSGVRLPTFCFAIPGDLNTGASNLFKPRAILAHQKYWRAKKMKKLDFCPKIVVISKKKGLHLKSVSDFISFL